MIIIIIIIIIIRPIGVGEFLRRIVAKPIAGFLKEEIKEAAGPLQVCAGHSAGSEAATHAMSQVFVEEGTDGILLIDASNAFNQMNRSVALHNIQITCITEARRGSLFAVEVRYDHRRVRRSGIPWPCPGTRSIHLS